MRSYAWLEDVYNPRLIPGFEKVAEIDIYGRRTGQACLNHPDVRNFLNSLVEDYVKSHEIDGIMWGSERQGPLNNAIGSRHGGFGSSITCFCEFCRQRGRERGISVERAAYGIYTIVNNNMVNGIRRVSVERGYDPRDFVLVGAGGATAAHITYLAREMGIATVILPKLASGLCAFGQIISDVKYN